MPGYGTGPYGAGLFGVGQSAGTLTTWDDLTAGPLADLVASYTTTAAQNQLLAEATTACEDAAGRRLVPFAGLAETVRLEGIDPDEYPAGSGLPLTLETMGRASMGTVLGVGDNLVRHLWLREYAPRYQDLWTYSDVTVVLTDTAGAQQTLTAGTGLFQLPAADSGHLWLPVGTWAPIGSWATVTYSGGYTTIPADLGRAGKWMTAAIAADELDPLSQQAPALRAKAEALLEPYCRC